MRYTLCSLAGAVALACSPAFAQSAPSTTTIGAGSSSGGSATVGTGGTGAAGGTSATTLGTGGTSTGPAGTSSTIGGGASAATTEGKASTSNKVQENPNMLQDKARAKAQDGGTWSKSDTKTRVTDEEASSRTRTMSHEPGGPPVKSTIEQNAPVQK